MVRGRRGGGARTGCCWIPQLHYSHWKYERSRLAFSGCASTLCLPVTKEYGGCRSRVVVLHLNVSNAFYLYNTSASLLQFRFPFLVLLVFLSLSLLPFHSLSLIICYLLQPDIRQLLNLG